MFKAMGDITRLQIIYLLTTDTSGKLGVSELAIRLGISQPAVSQHLKTLKSEGLVDFRREGFYIYYSINRERMVEFREKFEMIYMSVMEKCNRELIRKSTGDMNIRVCVIYYSYTGITRMIADGIRNASGCDIIEIKTKKPYTSFSAYTTGVLRSRKMACDLIEPSEIDVSGYDFLIIGTPVWAWKPTPAINAAVKALKGCENKKAVIFTTCGSQPGEALSILKQSLQARKVRVMGEFSLNSEDTKNPDAGGELIRQMMQIDFLGEPDKDLRINTESDITVTE